VSDLLHHARAAIEEERDVDEATVDGELHGHDPGGLKAAGSLSALVNLRDVSLAASADLRRVPRVSMGPSPASHVGAGESAGGVARLTGPRLAIVRVAEYWH